MSKKSRRARLSPPPAAASTAAASIVAAERLDRILLALALAGVVVLALHRIVAYDIWWQIGAGRWIAANGFPETDPFSYSATGRPWVELRWIWCLAVAGLHQLGGATALVVASAAIVLAAAVALARVAPAAPRWIAALAVSMAAALALFRLDLRPEIATFLCLALLLLWLARLYAGVATAPWWSLGLLQLVWTNSHTLFVLGPATLAIAWGAEALAAAVASKAPALWRGPLLPPERRSQLLRAALLAAIVCLANPFGWRGAIYPLTLWQELSSDSAAGRWIGELRSPFASFGWSFAALRFPVAVAVSLGALLANRRRVTPGWIALWGAYLLLGLRAERNLALFGWVAGTTTAVALAEAWRERRAAKGAAVPPSPRLAPRLAACALALFAIGSVASDAYYRRVDPDRRFGVGIAPGRFPDRPLDFLQRAGFDGRLLANLPDGGYVLFARGEQSVYIDGRLEVYGDEFLEQAMQLYTRGAEFEAVARRFDLRVVVAQFTKDGGLFRTLLRRRDWVPVYFDADRVAFAKAGPDATRWRIDLTRLGGALRTPLPGEAAEARAEDPTELSRERLLRLGRLAILVGDLERARTFYRRAIAGGVRLASLDSELAGLERILDGAAGPGGAGRPSAPEAILGYAAADGLEAALAGLEVLAARGDFSEPRAFAPLAVWSGGAARLDAGERIARAWTEHEPRTALAWTVRAAVALAGENPVDAVPSLERSLALEPGQLDAWIALAESRRALGDESGAADALARARELAPDDPAVGRLASRLEDPAPP